MEGKKTPNSSFNITFLVCHPPTHPQIHLSLSRDKRARLLRVQGHFSAVLQGRVFSSWVVYVSEERVRRELHSTAVGHFEAVTLKKVNIIIIVCLICVCTVSIHLYNYTLRSSTSITVYSDTVIVTTVKSCVAVLFCLVFEYVANQNC